MLVYQSKFSPKTKVGWIGSGSGGKSGPYDVRTPQVTHPGVDPREWSMTLGEQRKEPFAKNIEAAVARGLA